MIKENIENKLSIFEYLFFILFIFFPVSILLGNFLINLNILLISLAFIFGVIIKKIQFDYKNKIFILLTFFFTSLLINLIFSDNYLLSLPRIIKVFFVIFFIFSFRFLVINLSKEKLNLIYKVWSLIFIIVIFDLIIEFFTGENIFGLKSLMPGYRLGSFTGTESVIGNYFYGFVLIFLAYIYQNYPDKKILNLILAFLLIVISFLIGERSNFIKTFLIIILFSFFVYEIKFKIKALSILLICIFGLIFLNTSDHYKFRYFLQISKIFEKNGINKYLNNSQYGAHYNVAMKIFENNPIFGVGLKNFRVESFKKKYDDLDHPLNNIRGSTHPHQIHYEFLSETGIFGYFSFLIFIFFSIYFSLKSYFINKNNFQLASILFVVSSLIPLLPSGSFLSTFSSSFFWINYSIMIGYIVKN